MAILDDLRGDWNARAPLRPRTTVPWSQRLGVSWHWIGPGTGPLASGSHGKCLTQVLAWQRYHQSLGWKDVGYNALICQHARAIEGRGLEFEGSHSPGVNTAHVGVQFMVGEAGAPPTAAMLARAQRLRYDLGQLGPNIKRDWPHRRDPEASTGCPGDWIAKWAESGAPTNYTPTTPQEDDMAELDADNARQLFTTFPVMLDPDDGKTRVTPSSVIEKGTRRATEALAAVNSMKGDVARISQAVALLANTTTPPLDPARAEAVLREEIAKWLDGFTITQKEQS